MKLNQVYQAIALCVFMVFLLSGGSWAQEHCFQATGKANEDAQSIRLQALEMGWEVGKAASLTAAGIVKGKVKLYPKNAVDVCLTESVKEELLLRVQSRSEDAGVAKWHKVPAKRRAGEETRI